MLKVLGLAVVALGAAIAVASLPDLKRYLRMRWM